MLDDQAIVDAYERVRGQAQAIFPARTWAGWKQIAQELGFTSEKAPQVICNYLLIVKVQVEYEFRSNNLEGLKALKQQASDLILCLSHAHTASQSQEAGQEDEWLRQAQQPQQGLSVATRLHRIVAEDRVRGPAGQEFVRYHVITNPGSLHPRTEPLDEAQVLQQYGPGILEDYRSKHVQTQSAAQTRSMNLATEAATTSYPNITGHGRQPSPAVGPSTHLDQPRPDTQSHAAAGNMPPGTAGGLADHGLHSSGLISRLSAGLTGDAAQHMHRTQGLPASSLLPTTEQPANLFEGGPSVLSANVQAVPQQHAVPTLQKPAQVVEQQPPQLHQVAPVSTRQIVGVQTSTQQPQTQAAQLLQPPARLQYVSGGAPAHGTQHVHPSEGATTSLPLPAQAQPAQLPGVVPATATVASGVDQQFNGPVAPTQHTTAIHDLSRLGVPTFAQPRQLDTGIPSTVQAAAQPPPRSVPAKRRVHFAHEVEVIVIDDDEDAMDANGNIVAGAAGGNLSSGMQLNPSDLLPIDKRPRTEPTGLGGEGPLPAAPSAIDPAVVPQAHGFSWEVPFSQRVAERKAQRQAALENFTASAARLVPPNPKLQEGMQAYMECKNMCKGSRTQSTTSRVASARLNTEAHRAPSLGAHTLGVLLSASISAVAGQSAGVLAAAATMAEKNAALLFANLVAVIGRSRGIANLEQQPPKPQWPLVDESIMPESLSQPLIPLGTLDRKDVLVPQLPPAPGSGKEEEFKRSRLRPDAGRYKSDNQPWPKYVVFSHFPWTQMRDLALRQHRRSGVLDMFHALSSRGISVPTQVKPADIVEPRRQVSVQGQQQTQQPLQQVLSQQRQPDPGPSHAQQSVSQAAATVIAPPPASAYTQPDHQERVKYLDICQNLRMHSTTKCTNTRATAAQELAATAPAQPPTHLIINKPATTTVLAHGAAQGSVAAARTGATIAGQQIYHAPAREAGGPQAAAAAATAPWQAAALPQVAKAAAAAPGKRAAADMLAAAVAMPVLVSSARPPARQSAPFQPVAAGTMAAPLVATNKPSAEDQLLHRPAKKSRGLLSNVLPDAELDRPVEVRPARLGLTGTGAARHASTQDPKTGVTTGQVQADATTGSGARRHEHVRAPQFEGVSAEPRAFFRELGTLALEREKKAVEALDPITDMTQKPKPGGGNQPSQHPSRVINGPGLSDILNRGKKPLDFRASPVRRRDPTSASVAPQQEQSPTQQARMTSSARPAAAPGTQGNQAAPVPVPQDLAQLVEGPEQCQLPSTTHAVDSSLALNKHPYAQSGSRSTANFEAPQPQQQPVSATAGSVSLRPSTEGHPQERFAAAASSRPTGNATAEQATNSFLQIDNRAPRSAAAVPTLPASRYPLRSRTQGPNTTLPMVPVSAVPAQPVAQPIPTSHGYSHQAAAAEQQRVPPPGPASSVQQAHHQLTVHPAPASWGRKASVLRQPRLKEASAAYRRRPQPEQEAAQAASPLLQAVLRLEAEVQAATAEPSEQAHAAHTGYEDTAGYAWASPRQGIGSPSRAACQQPSGCAPRIRGISVDGQQQQQSFAAATAPGPASNPHLGLHPCINPTRTSGGVRTRSQAAATPPVAASSDLAAGNGVQSSTHVAAPLLVADCDGDTQQPFGSFPLPDGSLPFGSAMPFTQAP